MKQTAAEFLYKLLNTKVVSNFDVNFEQLVMELKSLLIKMESFAVGYRQQSSIFQYNMTCNIVFKNILFIFNRFKLKL